MTILSENVEKKRASWSWNQIPSLPVGNHLAHTNPGPHTAERPFPWADPEGAPQVRRQERVPSAQGSSRLSSDSERLRVPPPFLPLSGGEPSPPRRTRERRPQTGLQAAACSAPLSLHPASQQQQKHGLLVEVRDSEPLPEKAASPKHPDTGHRPERASKPPERHTTPTAHGVDVTQASPSELRV